MVLCIDNFISCHWLKEYTFTPIRKTLDLILGDSETFGPDDCLFQFYPNPLQLNILAVWDNKVQFLDQLMHVTSRTRLSLVWWLRNLVLNDISELVIFIPEEYHVLINILQLRAIHLSLQMVDLSTPKSSDPDSLRQCYSYGIHQSSGRNQKS